MARQHDFAAIDWADVSFRLVAYARRRLGKKASPGDAEDLAQAAVARLFDPSKKGWDPDVEPDLFRFLGSVVNGLLVDRRRKRREVLGSDGDREEAPTQDAETELAERQWRARAQRAVRRRLEGDALGERLFDLMLEGCSAPADQTAATGHPIDDIRNARKRLRRHCDAAALEVEGDAPTRDDLESETPP